MEHYPKPKAKMQQNERLQMIFIGSMGRWHGLDRLLHGMYDFRQKQAETQTNINLKILGIGAESEETRLMVERLGLESCVQMIPPCSGAEFDAHLAQADVGIGTLGIHRIGIPLNSALKHRTYCAYGLPFVFGGEDADFPAEYPFCLRVASDETPVSIDAIRQFMARIHQQYPDVNQQIRDYAERKLDWNVKVKPVLGFLSNTR